MKKLFLIVLSLVLTAAMFTGCGCTNRNKPDMTMPTVMPTTAPTAATTAPTAAPTTEMTVPTSEASTPTGIGTGPMEDMPTGSTESTAETRSRMMPGTAHPSK